MYSLIYIYLSTMYYSILSILGLEKLSYISKTVHGLMAIIAVYIITINILNYGFTYKKIFIIMIGLLSVTLYFTTSLLYTYENKLYKSRFSYYVILCVIPLILGCIDAYKYKIKDMSKYIPIFVIIFTIGSFLATFYSSGSTKWGGYVEDNSGFNYQLCSYAAAYSFGLITFYILNVENISGFKTLSKNYVKYLLIGMGIINWIIILISGGKGGFVTGMVYIFYSLYQIKDKIKFNMNTLIKSFVYGILIIMVAYSILLYSNNSSISVSGFDRIIDFIQTGNTTGRERHYIEAEQSIKKSPIIGHGIGSVYYEAPPYTHNFFLDILVETGIIGLICWIVLLYILLKKMYMFISINKVNHLIMILFLGGFIKSMFSGYYLSHSSIMWTIGYVFSLRGNKKIFIKEKRKKC